MTFADFESERERDQPALAMEEERALAEQLTSAVRPRGIDPVRHERLLESALEDPFAEASAAELTASERLRDALEEGSNHVDLDLARSLSNAHAPSTLRQAVATPEARTAVRRIDARPKSRVSVRAAGGLAAISAGLAIAAAVLLGVFVRSQNAPAPPLRVLALAQSRSTGELFRSAAVTLPSERIDRIASLRERDLRANRYALWGVR